MSFLDDKRQEMQEHLQKLRPAVEEYHRLEAAVAALEDVSRDPALQSTLPAPPKRAARKSGRRGRPRGSGTRSKQALAIVQQTPGITITEMAERMGIQQNYLYRVLPGLQKEGLVRKQDGGWHSQEVASS